MHSRHWSALGKEKVISHSFLPQWNASLSTLGDVGVALHLSTRQWKVFHRKAVHHKDGEQEKEEGRGRTHVCIRHDEEMATPTQAHLPLAY